MTAVPHMDPPKISPRAWLALGFVCATILSSFAGYVVSSRLAERAIIQTERTSKRAAFEQSTAEFKTLVKRLNVEALDGRPTAATKAMIEDNLLRQHDQVSVSVGLLEGPDQAAAQRYLARLATYSDALEDFSGPENSGPYMQATGDLLGDQVLVLEAMQRAAGITSN